MSLRRWTLVPFLVASTAIAGCSSGKTSSTAAGSGASTGASAPVSGELTIHIKNFAFEPKAASVKVGTKVTWVNDDDTAHTATAESSGPFDTKNLGKSASGGYTFTTPGTFSYICSIHQYMKGTVTVVG